MAKCIPYEGDFDKIPDSFPNTYDALIRLGELAPERVKRKVLGNKYNQMALSDISKKVLYKMGISCVRLYLNRHLGKSGKYSNRLIKTISNLKSNTSSNGKIHIISMVPKKEYFKVISAIYCLLWAFDYDYAQLLLGRYNQNTVIYNNALKCVIPIHTNLVIRSQPERVDGKELKRYILHIEGRI